MDIADMGEVFAVNVFCGLQAAHAFEHAFVGQVYFHYFYYILYNYLQYPSQVWNKLNLKSKQQYLIIIHITQFHISLCLRNLLTTENTPNGIKNKKSTKAIQYFTFFCLFFFRIRKTQNMQGNINEIALEAMAPTTLNTSSISSTAMEIPMMMPNKMIVQIMKNIFACLFRFILSSVWIQELIYYTLSLLICRYQPCLLRQIRIRLFVIAMKLFLAPKNMTGNEKNTEIRNPMFIKRQRASLVSSSLNANRKLPYRWFPKRQYPILPTKIQKIEQAATPVIEALVIFSSRASFMPTNIEGNTFKNGEKIHLICQSQHQIRYDDHHLEEIGAHWHHIRMAAPISHLFVHFCKEGYDKSNDENGDSRHSHKGQKFQFFNLTNQSKGTFQHRTHNYYKIRAEVESFPDIWVFDISIENSTQGALQNSEFDDTDSTVIDQYHQ